MADFEPWLGPPPQACILQAGGRCAPGKLKAKGIPTEFRTPPNLGDGEVTYFYFSACWIEKVKKGKEIYLPLWWRKQTGAPRSSPPPAHNSDGLRLFPSVDFTFDTQEKSLHFGARVWIRERVGDFRLAASSLLLSPSWLAPEKIWGGWWRYGQ